MSKSILRGPENLASRDHLFELCLEAFQSIMGKPCAHGAELLRGGFITGYYQSIDDSEPVFQVKKSPTKYVEFRIRLVCKGGNEYIFNLENNLGSNEALFEIARRFEEHGVHFSNFFIRKDQLATVLLSRSEFEHRFGTLPVIVKEERPLESEPISLTEGGGSIAKLIQVIRKLFTF